jgi:putative transposase
MKGKKTSVEQAIRILREIEVLRGQGCNTDEACRKVDISKQSYYKWRKEYGKMNPDKAKRLKVLESENARLKKLVADLSLDNAVLKEAAEGNY